MKIVNVIGGLGNQMFQFAFYLALKNRFPEETIKIYTKVYQGYSKHNAYELNRIFGIEAEIATVSETTRLAYPYLNYRCWQIGNHLLPERRTMMKEQIFGHYYEDAFNRQGDCFYDGYWQNEKYFSDIRMDMLMAYSPIDIDKRNMTIGRQLSSTNSVSIHVRHGDFLKKSIYRGICGRDYYKRAIDEMQSKVNVDQFCIFSNDIQWCKENIIPLLRGKNYLIIDWNTGSNSYLDMYLMSQCRNQIIAHSSFSWWGAWLNQYPNKIVVGPQKWNNIKNSEFELPNTWIKI